MADTLYLIDGALTYAGLEYIQRQLPKMAEAGLGWLTPEIDSLSHGDPWQDGSNALSIVQAWEWEND